MRDLRWQVPGGRRGGPKHGFGTAARGGLKQSFGAAAEAVANPLLYQTREGLGGWREHRERRVCGSSSFFETYRRDALLQGLLAR